MTTGIRTIEPADSPDALRAAGVDVVTGEERFTSPRTRHFSALSSSRPRPTASLPCVEPSPGGAMADPRPRSAAPTRAADSRGPASGNMTGSVATAQAALLTSTSITPSAPVAGRPSPTGTVSLEVARMWLLSGYADEIDPERGYSR